MGAIFPMAPLKARLGFVRKREKETRRAATAIDRAANWARRRADAVEWGASIMTAKTSLFAKIHAAVIANGQSKRTATRKARRVEAASSTDFVRLTPERQAGALAKSQTLRPEGRQAPNQSDADNQRPPV
jgi:hypothetical protein